MGLDMTHLMLLWGLLGGVLFVRDKSVLMMMLMGL